MKSLQFRNIAPKAPAVAPPPSRAVLSCKPPSAVPDAATAAANTSCPKSIIVPTQNYALMQIAGQDGTFSLVALPPSVSSQTPHHQTQTQPIQKNLKLPIPRYQPMRSKGSSDRIKPQPPASTVKTPSKDAMTTRARSAVGAHPIMKRKLLETKDYGEKPTSKDQSEQVILIDPAASEISVGTLLPDNPVLYPGSQLEQTADATQRTASTADMVQSLHYPTAPVNSAHSKAPEEGSNTPLRPSRSKPAAAQPPGSITVLSPAIFSKAVQIIPSPPKGKLPIPPYSKVKSALIPAAKLGNTAPEKNAIPGQQLRPLGSSDAAAKTAEKAEALSHNQLSNSTLHVQAKAALLPVLCALQKPPGKKRGRKRKTMEDILLFEARKKRSLSFFRRRGPEKPPATVPGSKQREVDISKKYRSIRPKPMLVMETVPQLVRLPAVASDCQERELRLGNALPGCASPRAPDCAPQPAPVALHLRGASHQRAFMGGRPLHRCPTCSRCFQFKHHLQSHMNSHTNSRPYVCPVCRKAYAHSGSLSTHMKLHHSEGRPLRTLRCEFCEKAFGYVGVYFSHLREVHKVVLTVEPSISQHEDDVPVEGAASSELPGDQCQGRVDPVELQIKCGRCQATTPTFVDMKLHLLYVHGEEVPSRLRDGRGGREAENELVKHAAHYWWQFNKKRNLVKCGSCDEEFFSFSKLRRHVRSHQRPDGGRLVAEEEEEEEDGEGGGTPSAWDEGMGLGVLAGPGSTFNCVLCSEVLETKEGVLEHWRSRHHCERPGLLWNALSCYAGHGEGEVEGDMDTPAPSPH